MHSSTQQADEAWDDYWARSDAQRERYHNESQDLKVNQLIEQDHTEWLQSLYQSGFKDQQEYEEYMTRLTHTYEHDRQRNSTDNT